MTSQTAPDGNAPGANKAAYTTYFSYDSLGQQTQVIAPPTTVTQFNTPANPGQPTTITANAISTTGYNTFGEPAETEDPDGNIVTITHTFDSAGEHESVAQNAYTAPGSTTPVTSITQTDLGADACLTGLARGTSPGSNPPGYTWAQDYVSQDLNVDAQQNINACHLIPAQVGGRGVLANLSTCGRPTNAKQRGSTLSPMTVAEAKIVAALRIPGGQSVYYQVIPRYEGSRTVPWGYMLFGYGSRSGVIVDETVGNIVYDDQGNQHNLGTSTASNGTIPVGSVPQGNGFNPMHSSIERLTGILTPPTAVDPIDWDRVTERWGSTLPADYRDFISTYGGGAINNSFYIGVPLAAPPEIWGPQSLERLTESGYELLEEEDPTGAPESPERISWAMDCTASYAFWDTRDRDPNNWPVVVLERYGEWVSYDCGMGDFLLSLLGEGTFDSPMALFSPERPVFLHWSEERRLRTSGINPWPGL